MFRPKSTSSSHIIINIHTYTGVVVVVAHSRQIVAAHTLRVKLCWSCARSLSGAHVWRMMGRVPCLVANFLHKLTNEYTHTHIYAARHCVLSNGILWELCWQRLLLHIQISSYALLNALTTFPVCVFYMRICMHMHMCSLYMWTSRTQPSPFLRRPKKKGW